MKISELSGGVGGMSGARGAHHVRESAPGHSFERDLTQMGEAQYRRHIEQLAQKIFEQGEVVAKKADIKELQKYREMITELLNETVSNAYEFSKSANFDRRGRHRVFATINQINRTLDDMAQEILEGQKDNLKLLHRVDDIRGMIVDMFF